MFGKLAKKAVNKKLLQFDVLSPLNKFPSYTSNLTTGIRMTFLKPNSHLKNQLAENAAGDSPIHAVGPKWGRGSTSPSGCGWRWRRTSAHWPWPGDTSREGGEGEGALVKQEPTKTQSSSYIRKPHRLTALLCHYCGTAWEIFICSVCRCGYWILIDNSICVK